MTPCPSDASERAPLSDPPADAPEAAGAPAASSAETSAAPASAVVPATCEHDLPLDGVEECRRCVRGGFDVREVVLARPDGARFEEIALLLGISKQGAQQTERRAIGKILRGLVRIYPELGREIGRVRLSDAQRFAAIVRRMLRDGFESDEIADNLNEPQWRVRRAIESKGA